MQLLSYMPVVYMYVFDNGNRYLGYFCLTQFQQVAECTGVVSVCRLPVLFFQVPGSQNKKKMVCLFIFGC